MLTDAKCRNAKATDRPLKLADAHGLHLYVTPAGHKGWRWKYRFGGKERRLIFGPYPEVSLAEARDRRDDGRRLLRDGIDPGTARKKAQANKVTLKQFADAWMALQADVWKPHHANEIRKSLAAEVFPKLGERPIADITPAEVRSVLETIQERGAIDLAHRTRGRLSLIFRLAIASDACTSDPAAGIGVTLKPVVKRKYPALLRLDDARNFVRKMEAEPALPTTKLASRLIALTAARYGTLRWAEPADFHGLDGEYPYWHAPAEKMKLERELSEQDAFDFIFPLSRQAVATIKVALAAAGKRKYLFPSHIYSHKPISENDLSSAYRRIGYARKHCPHGWRTTFSTIMNERASDLDRPGDRAVIDLMLAHVPRGVEADYNRAAYMKRRRELAQEWADLLMEGLPGPETLLAGRRHI